LDRLDYIARQEGRLTVSGVPQGYDAYVAGEAARRRKGPVLLVTLDDAAAAAPSLFSRPP
jgi:transcription-repair coupling factor (superfamily II helicase)